MALNAKQARFVQEYLVDLNATQAAIRAGYSEKTAYSQGQRLLKNAEVQSAIANAQGQRADRLEITQDMVLAELWAIATADPNEIVQHRRGACPKCWGEGDVEEQQEGQAHDGSLKRSRKMSSITDEDPNPDCEACGGEGMGRVWVADTRKLRGAARKLYAGAKVTKDGLEVKMHDKAAALVNVGKHIGMFKDRVEHTGNVEHTMSEEMKAWLDQR